MDGHTPKSGGATQIYIFLRTINWVAGNRRQIWKEFGEGGTYDQNMFCEVLKELIETKNVKSNICS